MTAHRIDLENKRLLKAIVDSKPHIELSQSQLDEYKKNTAEFKRRKHIIAMTDPANSILQKKSSLMMSIQSKVHTGGLLP